MPLYTGGGVQGQQIDFFTRCTYNLLTAASDETVPLIIMLSTLEVMTGYDPGLTVTETWRPRPSAAPRVLGKHLGEFTVREFARDAKAAAAALRAYVTGPPKGAAAPERLSALRFPLCEEGNLQTSEDTCLARTIALA